MLTIVTGGSGSGKSAFAEDKVLAFGEAQRVYIATMHPFDDHWGWMEEKWMKCM